MSSPRLALAAVLGFIIEPFQQSWFTDESWLCLHCLLQR